MFPHLYLSTAEGHWWAHHLGNAVFWGISHVSPLAAPSLSLPHPPTHLTCLSLWEELPSFLWAPRSSGAFLRVHFPKQR